MKKGKRPLLFFFFKKKNTDQRDHSPYHLVYIGSSLRLMNSQVKVDLDKVGAK